MTIKVRSYQRFPGLGVLLAAALVLAACGGNDDKKAAAPDDDLAGLPPVEATASMAPAVSFV